MTSVCPYCLNQIGAGDIKVQLAQAIRNPSQHGPPLDVRDFTGTYAHGRCVALRLAKLEALVRDGDVIRAFGS